MIEILQREFIYISNYFIIQFMQIIYYYLFGITLGSAINVFFKDKMINFASVKMQSNIVGKKERQNLTGNIVGLIFCSIIGILSPLCMYGTIPIAASFDKKSIKQYYIASFMFSSILLNPQLIIYSLALGKTVLLIRILSCFAFGLLAGIIIMIFYKDKAFFNFKLFEIPVKQNNDKNMFIAFFKSIIRNIEHTGLYFLIGILLSALFQRYINAEAFASLFGEGNKGFGVLLAATIGVPIYVCGGATVPLLLSWLEVGMSYGAASSFMITGPATKITNIAALKMVFGIKHFIFYFAYTILFATATGILINIFL